MSEEDFLKKIKIAIRNKIGKYYKYYDFYLKKGCFCYKEKTQSEFMESILEKIDFNDEVEFNEVVCQVYYRMENSFEEFNQKEKYLRNSKKTKAAQIRKLKSKLW
jgi:hypothetical protein